MQTFLPYPSFARSAACLDKKRCWKQVIEAKGIISILENPEAKSRIRNHPAVRQWKGYIESLKIYFDIFLCWSMLIHKIKTSLPMINGIDRIEKPPLPPWFGYEPYHASHRARLLEKDPEFYGIYKWRESPGPYIWPVDKEGKLLKEIEEWIGSKK